MIEFNDWINSLTPDKLTALTIQHQSEAALSNEDLSGYEVALYLYSRSECGQSERFALMAATRSAPGTKGTDRTFNENARARMENMTPTVRNRILKQAKAAGVDTAGKFYVSGLGKYHDQRAWVSTIDDIHDVAKANPHLTMTGLVNQKGRQTKEIEKVDLAEDLVQGLMGTYLQNPKEQEAAGKRNGMSELREKVIAKHGAKSRKK